MRIELGRAAPAASPWAALLRAPLAALCVLAAAAIGIASHLASPDRLTVSLGDTDDATRLVQLRELLAGAPWFDTTLPRFGGAEPLVSHWSRLIDLPLAVLIRIVSPWLDADRAELMVRGIWPLLLLAPLLLVLARHAEARGGRLAGLFAIALAATCMSGLIQFLPGRIDHHNAQILGAVAGALLLSRSFANPALGWPAGLLLGAGFVVGYEALLLTAATLALASLYACWTGRGTDAMARAAAAFAATLWLGFFATVAPSRWLVVHCDALSGNILLLASAAATGLAGLACRRSLSRLRRLAVLGAAGLAGVALFAASEPACLKGPFGQVDAAIVPIWLDSVIETQSILAQTRSLPLAALAWLMFAAAGIWAASRTLRPKCSDQEAVHALVVALAVAMSLWQLKLLPYASFLLVPSLAVYAARAEAAGRLSAPLVRCILLLLLNQISVTVAAMAVMTSLGQGPRTAAAAGAIRNTAPCLSSRAVKALGSLPPGHIVADRDLGPFIVALTPHSVLSAPYHRLGAAIVETHRIMTGPLTDSARRLRAAGADYVAVCAGLGSVAERAEQGPGSLRTLLLSGAGAEPLERVDMPEAAPISVWRMRR